MAEGVFLYITFLDESMVQRVLVEKEECNSAGKNRNQIAALLGMKIANEIGKTEHEGTGGEENKKGYKKRGWRVDKGAQRWGRKGQKRRVKNEQRYVQEKGHGDLKQQQ